jgi:hypothetical protein
MKTSIVRTLITLSVSAAIGPLSLLAQGPIQFTAPFDFTVGNKNFASGEYRMAAVAPQVLAIRSRDGRSSQVVIAHASQATSKQSNAVVTFNRYGDRYFLSRWSDPNHGWELPKSRVEKELIAKRASPAPVTVASSDPE